MPVLISKNGRPGYASCLILLMGTGLIAVNLFSGRNLRLLHDTSAVAPSHQVIVSQIITIIIISLSSILLATRVIQGHRPAKANLILWLGYMLFWLSTTIVPLIDRTLTHSMFYQPLIFTIICFFLLDNINTFLVYTKIILTLATSVSLFCILIVPNIVMEPYDGFIPGIFFRLWGTAEHPNSLGAISLTLLLIELTFPSTRKIKTIIICASLANIILAQSKTVWIATLMTILLFHSHKLTIYSSFKATIYHIMRYSFILCTFIATPIYLSTLFLNINFTKAFDNYAIQHNFYTLTGRTDIWSITWASWLNSPWIGSGHGLWNLEFRTMHNLMNVGQAHNQFLDTLGSFGIIGLISLLIYIYILFSASLKYFQKTNGLLIYLILFIIFRCTTESPFRGTLYAVASIMHFIIFTIIALCNHSQKQHNKVIT